jgi:hypothetical protein
LNELLNFNTENIGDVFSKKAKGNGMGVESRVVKPPKCREIPDRALIYQYAKDLAENIQIEKDSRNFVITDGTFIFGDLFEALIVKNNWHIKRMSISTLSLSQGNVDSLVNLIIGGFVDQLDLIVSTFFFSHERGMLIPYIYKELDIENRFQLAVASTHCKICCIETHCGLKITMHGSANLRSSGNIEQLMIEEGEYLYDFNQSIIDSIIEKYHTIKKPIRNTKLWQQVVKTSQQDSEQKGEHPQSEAKTGRTA